MSKYRTEVHRANCDKWKVFDNPNPEAGYERYIAPCDGSCIEEEFHRMQDVLKYLRDLPSPYRDPDGVDCYVDTVRLVCKDILDELA